MPQVLAFPTPPAPIRHALNVLAVLHTGDQALIDELGDIKDLPRPWDPATCDPELQRHLWHWTAQVVDWINTQFGWRTQNYLPRCWPQHPHLCHELPVLACLRYAANSTTPDLLEEWTRHALPMFQDRLASQLGGTTCRDGRHQVWPAASRSAERA